MHNLPKTLCSLAALSLISVSFICLLCAFIQRSSLLMQKLREFDASTVISTKQIENNSLAAMVTLNWTWPAIREKERKVFSQFGEDGVLVFLLEQVGALSNGSKYFVEFGVEDGAQCNTRILRQNYNWTGLMMDGSHENKTINLRKEFITSKNILNLFEKYQVRNDLALLSIDLDFDDYWIMKAIDFDYYRPIFIIIEYNCAIPVSENRVVDPMDTKRWIVGDDYAGAGIAAMSALAERKGYKIIYATSRGVNLFLVRKDILESKSVMTTSLERIAAYAGKECFYERYKKRNNPKRKWFWNDLQN